MGSRIPETNWIGDVMALKNYIRLESEKQKVLRFKHESFRIEPREITDPDSKNPKIVNAAVMDVTEEDGQAISTTFSTLSSKLAATLKTMHDNGTLYRGKIGITQRGSGYSRQYEVAIL